jgi:Asp-tRNA(Asn)/Glu-tRNA(Gln) amidotransferase A subunit family amidase
MAAQGAGEQQAFLAAHPDLYECSQGAVRLSIRDGRIALGSLAGTGFASGAMPDFDAVVERHRRLVAAEIAQVHADWFPRYGELYAPQTRELIERGLAVSPDQVQRDRDGRKHLTRQLEEARQAHGLDLWVSPPALGPAPLGLGNTGDPVMNLPWSHAGLPTLTLRAGLGAEGMPMGLQLSSGWDWDEELVAWGSGLEEALAG